LSRGAGVIAAILLAVNPFAIHYAQDARPYSLFLLLAATVFYFAVKWGREEQQRFRVGWGFCVVLVMYTHPYGIFVIPAASSVYLLYRYSAAGILRWMDWQQLFTTLAVSTLLMLPQLWRIAENFLGSAEAGQSAHWMVPPDLRMLIHTFADYMLIPNIAVGVLGLAGIAMVVRLIKRKNLTAQQNHAILAATLWCGFVLFLPWLISVVLVPFYVIRYTTPALLGWLLFWSVIFSGFKPAYRKGLTLLCGLLAVFPLYSMYTMRDKDPWRDAAVILQAEAAPGSAVVIYPALQRHVFEYYFDSSNLEMIYAEPGKITGRFPPEGEEVWWVQGYDWAWTDTSACRQGLMNAGYRMVGEIRVEEYINTNPRVLHMADVRLQRFVRKAAE
jgi:hypothetical protein